jgi:hypothetical protein
VVRKGGYTGFGSIIIGKLTKEVISLLGLNRSECDIILWEDRLKYIQKHIADFDSIEEYEKHTELIPEIIKNPDYVGKHPNSKSIEYIKRIDRLMLVAVRLKLSGDLAFCSAYPIREEQLESYIRSGRAYKVTNDKEKDIND